MIRLASFADQYVDNNITGIHNVATSFVNLCDQTRAVLFWSFPKNG